MDVFLSHLDMDHIQGLGFFAPLYDPSVDVHLWGPGTSEADLRARLVRYLSPPLFPVHLWDLTRLTMHVLPATGFHVGAFRVRADRICHPGFTVGFRIEADGGSLAYLSDHEPALSGTHSSPAPPHGRRAMPSPPRRTS